MNGVGMVEEVLMMIGIVMMVAVILLMAKAVVVLQKQQCHCHRWQYNQLSIIKMTHFLDKY